MARVFRSKTQAENIFRDFWKVLFQKTSVKEDLARLSLSVLVSIDSPEVAMYVDEHGVSFRGKALKNPALVTMKMSGDAAHDLMNGNLNLANAMAEMQIKALMNALPALGAKVAIVSEATASDEANPS